MGQGAPRNLGLSYARGDYLATLDSDDLWNPDFLERAISALEELEADVICCNFHSLAPDLTPDSFLERERAYMM
jgi:glycosyltransferase involved in cell wall biosynthesis